MTEIKDNEYSYAVPTESGKNQIVFTYRLDESGNATLKSVVEEPLPIVERDMSCRSIEWSGIKSLGQLLSEGWAMKDIPGGVALDRGEYLFKPSDEIKEHMETRELYPSNLLIYWYGLSTTTEILFCEIWGD